MLKGQKKGERSGLYKKCLTCAKESYIYLSHIKTGRGNYCSKRCAKVGRPSLRRTGTFKSCIMCNCQFYAPNWLRKIGGAKYCSTICYWESRIGKKSWNYEGKSSINESIRKSSLYKQWRIKVFKRDNYTCQICFKRGNNTLNADHIKPFAYYPRLRFKLSNGRTLCIDCHQQTDTYGNRSYNYKFNNSL